MTETVSKRDQLGSTGLDEFGGVITEEFLNPLKGDRRLKTYEEMKDNDPIVGALLFVIEMLIRQVPWSIEAGGDAPADADAAEFVRECRDDMADSWDDTLASILSFLPFGFSAHEIVYKRRDGEKDDQLETSHHDDGRIGWAALPVRAQRTVEEWKFGDHGEILGFVQQAPPRFDPVEIPWERFLLFRTTTTKGNPEGRSILRNSYRPWFLKKRIEEIEGIGIERDLAGLPVAHVPPHLLSSTASASDKALLAAISKLLRNIRRDEKEGVIFPLAYDGETNNVLYKLELLSTGGRRQFDTNGVINRYSSQMAMTVLADFILLGHQQVGSFALASDKTHLFSIAVGAWADMIAGIFNRFAIPRLMARNTFPTTELPMLVHGDLESLDLTALGAYVTALSGAGASLFPDLELENHLRRAAGLPEMSEKDFDDRPPKPVPPPFPPPPGVPPGEEGEGEGDEE